MHHASSAMHEIHHFPARVLTACLPLLAAAQSSSHTADDLGNLPVPSWGKAVIDSFEKPLHPIIGGVAPGGGIGFGVGYDSPDDSRWYREAEAMVTVRRYWSLQGEMGRRSSSRRSQIGVFGGVRHMSRIDFFGIGSRTLFDDRSAFRLRESTLGLRGSHRVVPAVKLGGSVAAYLPDLGRGANRSVPSIEQLFSRIERARRFVRRAVFGRYRGYVEFTHPALADPLLEATEQLWRRRIRSPLKPFATTTTAGTTFSDGKRNCSSAFRAFDPGHRLTLHGLRRVDQRRRRCAVLHALHAGRQRRPEGVQARHARQRRYSRDAARLPKLPLPRPQPAADAGGISHPASSNTCTRRCSSTRARWRRAHRRCSARSESQPASASVTCAKAERLGGWMWASAAAKACTCSGASERFSTETGSGGVFENDCENPSRPRFRTRQLRGLPSFLLCRFSCRSQPSCRFRSSPSPLRTVSRNCLAAARSLTMTPTSRRLSSSMARKLMLPRNIS